MALQIEVQSNSKQARDDLARLNKSVGSISKSTQAAAKGLQRTIALISVGVAAFAAGTVLTRTTDSYKRLEARIALTNKGLVEQEFAFRKINDIAIRTRNSQEQLADLYSRIGRATRRLGVEQKTVLKVTETISKAITVSGASAESAASAIVQLGQGLAAGALRGQELNSVMEQTPAVAAAIARGMGITIGDLRAYAEQGKLTAGVIVESLTSQADFIDEEFSRIAPTFAQGMLVLSLGAGRFIKEIDNVTGASTRLNKRLLRIGKFLNDAARPFAETLANMSHTLDTFAARLSPIGDGFKTIASSFGTLGRSISDALSFLPSVAIATYLFDNLALTLSSMLPSIEGITIFLHRLANGINFVASTIGHAFAPIKDFLAAVGQGFYDLYIEVVGNSTWPDLIDGVINYAKKIGKALGFIFDFMKEVGKAFAFGLVTVVGLFSNFYVAFISGIAFLSSAVLGTLGNLFTAIGNLVFGLSDLAIFSLLALPFELLGMAFSTLANLAFVLSLELYSLASRGARLISDFGVSKIVKAFKGMGDAVKGFQNSFSDDIYKKTGLKGVLSKVEDFGESVKNVFYDIYNDVVGNSTWPDLIDGVINYTKKIGKASGFIFDFIKEVGKAFAFGLATVVGLFSNFFVMVTSGISFLASAVLGTLGNLFTAIGNLVFGLSDLFLFSLLALPFELLGMAFSTLANLAFVLSLELYTLASSGARLISDFGFSKIVKAFKGMGDAVKGFRQSFSEDISNKTVSGLKGVLSKVEDFGESVKGVFYDIYNDVVGNSTWPDLIDGVGDYTVHLKKPLNAIKDFAIAVKEYFQDLSEEVIFVMKTILFFFSPITAVLVATATLLQSLGAPISTLNIARFGKSVDDALDNALDKVVSFASAIGDTLSNLTEEALRVVSVGIGAFVTAVLFGVPGVVASLAVILLSELDSLFGESMTLTSENLKSFVTQAGVFVGIFVAAFLAALPDAGAVVANFFKGVLQGLVSEIPIIGEAIAKDLEQIFQLFEGLFNALGALFVANTIAKLFGFKGTVAVVASGLKKLFGMFVTFYTSRQATAVAAEGLLTLTHSTGGAAQIATTSTTMARMTAIFTGAWATIVARTTAAWATVVLVSTGALTAISLRVGLFFALFSGAGIIGSISLLGAAIVAFAAKVGLAFSALLLNPIVALIVGGALVIGALGVAIFGEGDSFLGKLKNIKAKMDEFFTSLFSWNKDGEKTKIQPFIESDVPPPSEDNKTDGRLKDLWAKLQKKVDGMEGIDTSGWLNLEDVTEKAKTPFEKIRTLFDSIGASSKNADLLALDSETAEKQVTIFDKIKSFKDQILNSTNLTLAQEREITKSIEKSKMESEILTKINVKQLNTLTKKGYTQEYLRRLSDEELETLIDQRATVDGLLVSYQSMAKGLKGLSEIDISMPLLDFNRLSKKAQQDLLDMSRRADELSTILSKIPGTDEGQLRYDAAVLEMEQLTKAAAKFNKQMEKAKNFTSELRGGFQDTIEGIFKGINDIGDLFDTILNSIADRAIEGLSESITNVVLGEDEGGLGALQGLMDTIFGSPEDNSSEAAGDLASSSKGITLGLAAKPMFVKVISGLGSLTDTAKVTVESILPGAENVGAVAEGGAGGAAEAATTGLGIFAEKVMTSASGLGDWASQALTSIAQFFGLSVATQSQTATSTIAATQAGVLSAAFALLTVTANALASALATAAAASSAASGASSVAGGMFGFATGGAVNGPGTGTSDSIMAMLSNGEYVINAASTKKFRPILEAINNGSMEMPAFADGGAVDLQGASNKVMKEVAGRPGTGGQQTIQNINITGDISRQTKKEIYSMMPTIAQGVNQQNKEQNR